MLKYIKLLLPVLVLASLIIFKRYYSDDLSNAAINNFKPENAHKSYAQFDLTTAETNYRGTLLEFGATTCIECKKMEKVLAEIRDVYAEQLQISFINTTKKEGLLLAKEFGIISIPMQVLLDQQGLVVYKHAGYISTNDLAMNIKEYILK